MTGLAVNIKKDRENRKTKCLCSVSSFWNIAYNALPRAQAYTSARTINYSWDIFLCGVTFIVHGKCTHFFIPNDVHPSVLNAANRSKFLRRSPIVNHVFADGIETGSWQCSACKRIFFTFRICERQNRNLIKNNRIGIYRVEKKCDFNYVWEIVLHDTPYPPSGHVHQRRHLNYYFRACKVWKKLFWNCISLSKNKCTYVYYPAINLFYFFIDHGPH